MTLVRHIPGRPVISLPPDYETDELIAALTHLASTGPTPEVRGESPRKAKTRRTKPRPGWWLTEREP